MANLKATQLQALLDRGIEIVVNKPNGIREKYRKDRVSGLVVISYAGNKVCESCGKRQLSGESCRCAGKHETLSLTGAYRHLNSVAMMAESNDYSKRARKLFINERRVV